VGVEKNKMRTFLFKILFRLTWWVAPKTKRVQRFFSLYVEFIDLEDAKLDCQHRQDYLNKHTRPRTETYEHLTCKKQRDVYTKLMPPRFKETEQPRSHYSDYDEAKAYHESQ
jgi:hypothetical protein